jgi:hypothetical protein
MSNELTRVVSGCTVKMNQFDFAIVAGSLKYKSGKPTRKVKGTERGDTTFSENFEDAVGVIMFDLDSTKENIDKINILENGGFITTKFYDEHNFRKTQQKGLTTNDSERAISADGTFSVEVQGTRID